MSDRSIDLDDDKVGLLSNVGGGRRNSREGNDFRIPHSQVGGGTRGAGSAVESGMSELNSLSGWTSFLTLKKLMRRVMFVNLGHVLLSVFILVFLVCVVAEASSYAQGMVGKLSGVDFDALSSVAQDLKNIDFQEWNRDLNDIQTIKNTVAGYDVKVNQIMTEVAEMLKIMREVEKYINGTGIPNINGLNGGNGLLGNLNLTQILEWWQKHQSN